MSAWRMIDAVATASRGTALQAADLIDALRMI
jgi:hypothetical protein